MILRALKKYFRNISIRKKLTLVILTTTVIALIFAYSTFIYYDVNDAKNTKVDHLNTLAEMISFNCTAALTFNDANDATKTLSALTAEKNIIYAAILNRDMELFATYQKLGLDSERVSKSFLIQKCPINGHVFSGNHLYILRLIVLNNSCIGYVYLESGLEDLKSRVTSFTAIAVLFACISLLVAFAITARLQTAISKPILHLAAVARSVTDNRDYSLRATKYGSDEVGALIVRFNDMLSEIQIRDYELQTAQHELEIRAHRLQDELTERKRAEQEAARMQSFLQNVIDSMPSVMVTVNPEGLVQQWNLQAERATGIPRDEAHSQPLEAVYPMLAGEMTTIRHAIAECQPETRERVTMHVEGEERFADIMIYPLITSGIEGAVIRVDDSTERVRIEEMMIQTEKMMSVGGLAAGMAHEINNPLGIIIQSAQNMLRRVSPDVRKNTDAAMKAGVTLQGVRAYFEDRGIFEFLADINEAGKRAATIVTNMLNFSRRTESNKTFADIGDLLKRTVALAANDYDLKKKYDFRRIEIVYDLDPDLPKVPCIETKIEQVFLNLLRNAAQSLSESENQDAPRIICRTRLEDNMARIEVEDNGPGMPDHIRRRVFEPFFTTKDVGTGTGLGLSVSYFIVTENHDGLIDVESSPGLGAKFILQLPMTLAPAIEAAKPSLS